MANLTKKVLLCAIGKLENHYIREWVEYHKNLGFNNIVLYDNNDPDGEYFEDVIGDYIESGYVILKNWRGRNLAQVPAYNDCYRLYNGKYDWIAYWDIDEFIQFEKAKTIQEFLSLSKFNDAQCIRIGWKQYTDNGLVSVINDNYSIKRFKEVLDAEWCCKHKKPVQYHISANTQAKSIIRTGIKNFHVTSPHCFLNVATVNAIGEKADNRVQLGKYTVWRGAWLNHYRFKTIEEYVTKKMVRLWPTTYLNGGKDGLTLDFFFKFNEKTPEKIKLAERLIQNKNKKNINVTGWFFGNNETNLKHNNWGDDINFFFLSKIFDANINKSVKSDTENYAIIGSIINDNFINHNTIIWGAGIMADNILKEKPKKVCAVRGPVTRECLIKQGIDCPEIYGDPALLLPYFYNPKTTKKYKIGIVPHWSSINSPLTKNFIKDKRVHLINLMNYGDWHSVIDEVLSCEYIISESLHGLILAEAYGIPNLWVDITLNGSQDDKYHDFFLSLQADREKPIKIDESFTVESAFNEMRFYKKGVMVNLSALLEACPIPINNKWFLNRVKMGTIIKTEKPSPMLPPPPKSIQNKKPFKTMKPKPLLRSSNCTIHTFYS